MRSYHVYHSVNCILTSINVRRLYKAALKSQCVRRAPLVPHYTAVYVRPWAHKQELLPGRGFQTATWGGGFKKCRELDPTSDLVSVVQPMLRVTSRGSVPRNAVATPEGTRTASFAGFFTPPARITFWSPYIWCYQS